MADTHTYFQGESLRRWARIIFCATVLDTFAALSVAVVEQTRDVAAMVSDLLDIGKAEPVVVHVGVGINFYFARR